MSADEATLRAGLDYFTGPLAVGSSPEARDLAARRILELGDAGYPAVLDIARRDGRRSPGVLELLARFGRADSVPLLAEVLADGSDEAAWAAGQALGIHPAPAALRALVDELDAKRISTVVAALGGLRRRGDRTVRSAIQALVGSSEAAVSYAAQSALAEWSRAG